MADATSFCNITIKNENVLNASDCFNNWMSNINGQYIPDTGLRLVSCYDICIKGNYYWWHDGTYKWLSFSTSVNGSIYYCQECHGGIGKYIYPRIWSSGQYRWLLGSDSTESAYSSFCVTESVYSEHSSSLNTVNDCPNNTWKTYVYGEPYHIERNMVKTCNCMLCLSP